MGKRKFKPFNTVDEHSVKIAGALVPRKTQRHLYHLFGKSKPYFFQNGKSCLVRNRRRYAVQHQLKSKGRNDNAYIGRNFGNGSSAFCQTHKKTVHRDIRHHPAADTQHRKTYGHRIRGNIRHNKIFKSHGWQFSTPYP